MTCMLCWTVDTARPVQIREIGQRFRENLLTLCLRPMDRSVHYFPTFESIAAEARIWGQVSAQVD